jgi:transcriptional regulator with XRE-family HTH domain
MALIVKKFGKYLRTRRESKSWTLRQLAHSCRMPHTSLYQIERGITDPPLSRLYVLAGAFGEDLVAFLAPVVAARKKAETPAPQGTTEQ